MTADLTCYGDLTPLHGVVGDFDLRSPMDVHTWYHDQWRSIADPLGFTQAHEAELSRVSASSIDVNTRIRASNTAGINAFARALRDRDDGVTAAHARVQEGVLRQLLVDGQTSGQLWRVTADPMTVTAGACYPDADGQLSRAFYPDPSPGYFGDGWRGPPPPAESACGWTTPLTLHLGTFPWVYSTRLESSPAALRWTHSTLQPAIVGMTALAHLLEPAGNLRQDARQVAAIYQHFRAQTEPLILRLPQWQVGRAQAGTLYSRAGRLHVHQGSTQIAGLMGPRGWISAPAYNYCVTRFAAFFALRRAILRALPAFPELRQLAASSPDPCLHAQLKEARLAV
jgi:hypothetical protein